MVAAVAIVLDMDGLMVDSEPLARRAWDRVLAEYGYILDDAIYRSIIGHKTNESAAILIKAYDLSLEPEEFAHKKKKELAEIRTGGVPAMPGLFELHVQIANRNLPWGVATSSPRSDAEQTLEQLGLAASCQSITGGDEVGRGKPAPDTYLLAAERLGIPARRCLAVEDSGPGCQAALAAGMMVAAVPNADTRAADFSAVDYVFPSLHDLAGRIDAMVAELKKR
jgi:HAD superfamily hydrolase (TIGR01509 family)